MSTTDAAPVWVPPPGQEEYYNTPAPQDAYWTAHQVVLPFLRTADPTYGRGSLPRSPAELAIRDNYPHWDGKVLTGAKKGDEWVAFQVWEPKKGSHDKKTTLLWNHGVNDFGGKFAIHAEHFLEQGYSIASIDLPSHGRSTGIHVHLPDFTVAVTAAYEVMRELNKHDAEAQAVEDPTRATVPFKQTRKIFVGGQSLGGWVAAATCLRYGPTDSASDANAADEVSEEAAPPPEDEFTPTISGGIFLCPMLQVVPGSRPSWSIEMLARGIATFAGSLPLAGGHRGRTSEDLLNEQMFHRDPQTYHGKLRVSTGLAILKALVEITPKMPHLNLPFVLCHGDADRVTSHLGSQKLYEEASSKDKEINVYPGYEHILLRKGRDEEDDKRRQVVLGDMLDWLNRH